jgi:hypothetical protein
MLTQSVDPSYPRTFDCLEVVRSASMQSGPKRKWKCEPGNLRKLALPSQESDRLSFEASSKK